MKNIAVTFKEMYVKKTTGHILFGLYQKWKEADYSTYLIL